MSYQPNYNRSFKVNRNNKSVGPSEECKKQSNELEIEFGFERINEGSDRLGWLMNMQPSDMKQVDTGITVSAVDYYFIQEDGNTFKVTLANHPYFYIYVPSSYISEVESHLKVKYERYIYQINTIYKEDLDLRNHLSGLKKQYLQIRFHTINDLLHVRSKILPFVNHNNEEKKITETYSNYYFSNNNNNDNNDDDIINDYNNRFNINTQILNPLQYIQDIREADVPFYIRTSIDFNIRVGFWYDISFKAGNASLKQRTDLLDRAELRVFAFDIETTKLPLRFPDSDIDSIMMISYMIDGQGYLIINRECVSEDIEDFEYTPKPEFEGPFIIFNEKTEIDLLHRFFDHIKELKPNIYVTFNGDFFDWPFIDNRASLYNINMSNEIGVYKTSKGEYKSRFASHLDAYKWVCRDSYLPVGSQGLKAVTKAKLGYNPVEVDPEDMVRFALEKPQTMASYSVSDAVATYYLYMKYVHPFIFSLCTIIPMNPDDVLRKGSGTLCETLLMVEAAKANIIFPNKQITKSGKTYDGHLLESETYVGGHVEALESGVFRNDLPEKFELNPKVFQELIDELDNTLKYTIEIEEGLKLEDIENYNDIKNEILTSLLELKSTPNLKQCPNIYHLDVGAMYPNIILTNRLQPSSIVSKEDCASCDYNTPENNCQRNMKWTWRGDYIPASSAEYKLILTQLESEKFKPKYNSDDYSITKSKAQYYSQKKDTLIPYSQLPKTQQNTLLTSRLKDYSKKVYGKTHQISTEIREDCVCQRENPFYVDTVRAFRDRRYKYKNDLKIWKNKLDKALKKGNIEEIQYGKNMNILYDSLQLAHKCILNSFYGYVMRKGARWFSMEMAGIVTYLGADIIKKAREVLEGVGKPLELDTDGIWTLLPKTFPENYQFIISSTTLLENKRKIVFSYPCVVLNYRVRKNFLNDQYQILDTTTGKYNIHKECSIFFEVDGPYRAMILPASTEEGKKLKKRYAVFNNDIEGSLAELKGFEVKRRGELKLIKYFQSQVFKTFLKGSTLEECYNEVSKIANHWLDILYTKGKNIIDDELLSLISCSSNMSRKLEEYGSQKSTAITTAKRLAEFLGNQIVKDKGLSCKFIIASLPARAPVVERAIPVTIFSADPAIKLFYLKKWLALTNINKDLDIRDIIDWDYYINRLGGTIRKIITIPAAFQKINNPIPRLPHPSWLIKKIEQNSGTQLKITFKSNNTSNSLSSSNDIEDLFNISSNNPISTPLQPIPRISKINQENTNIKLSNSRTKYNEKLQKEKEEQEILKTPIPSIVDNFDEWLKWSKIHWKYNKQNNRANIRKRKNRPFSISPNIPVNKKRKIGNYQSSGLFTKQQDSLYEKNWHIIQITCIDNSPGNFRVWSLIDDNLYPIQLSVSHLFYIHSKTKNPNNIESYPNVKLSDSKLPHSKISKYLYELKLSEHQYHKNIKYIQSLSSFPDIEGIYESNIPNIFRILLQLGCICNYSNNNNNNSSSNISSNGLNFHLDELTRISNTNTNDIYLSNPSYFKICYLYSSFTESRSMFCLIFPHSNIIHLIFITSLPKVSTPNIESLYDKYLPNYTINMEIYKQKSLGIRKLNDIISDYKKKTPGPTIFLLQSALNANETSNIFSYSNGWKILREFPCVSLNGNIQDNQYPAFAWEGYCIKLLKSRFDNAKEWFSIQSKFCNYAQIPIGNLVRDYPILLSDLSYSRLLKQNNYLLWISPTTFPDLGSICYSHSSLLDEIQYPEKSKSGCFTSVTVTINIRNLALNTILQSHHVNDIEHISINNNSNQSSTFNKQTISHEETLQIESTLDDSLICFPAFRILKQLLSTWVLDLNNESHKNFAEVLLDHIYRWISSPTSLLYDPSLLHYIHSLMKKVFLQLLAEFRNLGATIIYASFNQLIINTPKHSTSDAISYIDFTLNTIKSKKLFSWLNMESQEYWETCLFLDQANYSAICMDNKTFKVNITSKWDMINYLPENLQIPFNDIINDYTSKIHSLFYLNSEENTNPLINQQSNQISKQFIHQRKLIMRNHITPRLFNCVNDTQHSMSTVQQSTTLSPSLYFIQYICKILSLDTTISQEICKLQKNLYKLAQIREFSKEAEFKNPSSSYILYDVMCQYCSSVCNLDLLRDSNLINGNWKCIHCKHEYDKIGIEKRLIDILKRKSLAYQLQDLICEKCNQVKEDNTGLYCKNCSGKYKLSMDKQSFNHFLKRFNKIAILHKFEWLNDITKWMDI